MSNQDMCLVSLLHDPEGKLVSPSQRYFREIRDLYTDVIIETTPESQGHLMRPEIYLESAKSLGEARRRVLWNGLDKTNCDYFHFCDFDRLLWWYINYPEELRHVICNFKTGKMVVLGRTSAAMDSHPWLQQETEKICNSLFFVKSGYEMDILAASRVIPRALAIEIVEKSKEENPACTDAEWPLIIGQERVQYLEVNGLGYESGLLGIEKSWEDEVEARLGHLNSLARMLNE